MVEASLVVFGIVALLALALGVTLYRVLPCWFKGETVKPESEGVEGT